MNDGTSKSGVPAKRANYGTLVASVNPRTHKQDLVNVALDAAGGDVDTAMRMLAQYALQVRDQDIALLGDGQAFLRRTSAGSLVQVVEVVTLSTKLGDLYHIAQYKGGKHINEGYNGLTVQGIEKINAVASVMTGQTPTVVVDGIMRTNPYIERTPDGGIRRIVVGVQVVGPSPATGQPVLSMYVLDYDPRKDFLHMLAEIEKNTAWSGGRPKRGDMPDYCKLVDRSEVTGKSGTRFVELYDGVGYLVDLRDPRIREVYSDWINLLMNAPKKALTVARRNALLKHPAIGKFKTVAVDQDGVSRIGVRGWAGDDKALAQYQGIAQQIARGIPVDSSHFEVSETIEATDANVYEPEEDGAGTDDDDDTTPSKEQQKHQDKLDADERAQLIETIDHLVEDLPGAEMPEAEYEPDNMSIADLQAYLAEVEEARKRVNAEE